MPPTNKNKPKNVSQSKSTPKEQPTRPIRASTPEQAATPVPEPSDASASDQEMAAIKIQASFRGYKTRKDLDDKKVEQSAAKDVEDAAGQNELDSQQEEDEDKRKREQAATTIQSNYRGFKTRQDLKAKKEDGSSEKADNDNTATDSDAEQESAATTIQAGYRGYQARKRVKSMKEEVSKEDEEARAPRSQSASNVSLHSCMLSGVTLFTSLNFGVYSLLLCLYPSTCSDWFLFTFCRRTCSTSVLDLLTLTNCEPSLYSLASL